MSGLLTRREVDEIAAEIMIEEPSVGAPAVAHELYRLTRAVLLLTRVVLDLPAILQR